MNAFIQAPLLPYEKEDIVRRAMTKPEDWVNPFPNMHPIELQSAEQNLRIILRDIRMAKFEYRMKEAEERARQRDRYLD